MKLTVQSPPRELALAILRAARDECDTRMAANIERGVTPPDADETAARYIRYDEAIGLLEEKST